MKVLYIGPYRDFTGYGEAATNYILAMDEVGIDVVPRPLKLNDNDGKVPDRLEELEKKSEEGAKICIQHCLPRDFVYDGHFFNIGAFAWETDSFHHKTNWVEKCNLMDEIWTGAQIHKEHFLKAGIKVPIYVFPQAVDTDFVMPKAFHVPGHKGYLFYSIFQWIERKNPRALLRAYWKEFQGEENVSLALKVYRFGFDFNERKKN